MTIGLTWKTLSVETRHGRIEVFEQDDPIGLAFVRYGEWAELETQALCAFLRPGDCVVDVGANIGAQTIGFSHCVGAAGRVLAFEPQPAVFGLLQRNVAACGLGNVRLLCAGAGSGTGEMVVPDVDYQSHINVGSVRLLSAETGAAGARVPIASLDGSELESCHLVKVDAEGMEADVLAGMPATLRRFRPVVALECNSVADGAAALSVGDWTGYRTFLLRSAAFNPDNFRASRDNFFGVAHESTLLFVPQERQFQVPVSRPGAEILPVQTLDELAIAVFETPRFPDITIYDKSRSRQRRMPWDLATADADATRELERLDFRARSLTHQLWRAEEQIAALEDFAVAAAQETDRRREPELAELEPLRRRLAEREDQLAEREGRLAEVEQQIAKGEQALAEAGQRLAECQWALAEAEQECADCRRKLADSQRDLNTVLRSASWRVTTPLRSLRILFGPARS